MKKHLFQTFSITAFLVLTIFNTSWAQGEGSSGMRDHPVLMPIAPNAIYLELLGNGLFYTINYDRLLSPDVGIRVGFGYLGLGAGNSTTTNPDGTTSDNSISARFIVVPATLNYFICSQDHRGRVGSNKWELGLGILYINVSVDFFGFQGTGSVIGETATVGYRYQAYDGGFIFRIGFTPVYIVSRFQPWGGLSLGFGF